MSDMQVVNREQAKWIALRALKFPEPEVNYYVIALWEGKLSGRGSGYNPKPDNRLDRRCWIARVYVSRKEDEGILMCPTPVTDVWIDQCTGEVLGISHGRDNDEILTRPYGKP